MAKIETDIVHDIQKTLSPMGARLWKNVRGMFLTLNGARTVRAGLQADGASDLIGFRPLLITPDMVGTTIAQFVCLEIKSATGVVSPQQRHFIEFVKKSGGVSGVARSAEDAARIVSG